MTTRVLIDAHAGWPVEVTFRHGEPYQPKSASVEVVDPGTEKTFYIHSGLEIVGIRELERPH